MFVSYQLQKEPDDFNDRCIVLYTHGCKLRCAYCFNPSLVLPEKAGFYLSEKTIKSLLEKARKDYDYVVITGGDPMMHAKELFPYLKFMKDLKYKIEICTTGIYHYDTIIAGNMTDLMRIDYKCVKSNYKKFGYTEGDFELMEETVSELIKNNINYEVRTTLHQKLISQKQLEQIVDRVLELGVKNYGVIFFDNSVPTIGSLPNFKKSAYDLSYCEGKFEKFTKYCDRNIK